MEHVTRDQIKFFLEFYSERVKLFLNAIFMKYIFSVGFYEAHESVPVNWLP